MSTLGERIGGTTSSGQERYTWRPLRLFAYYRVLVALMLSLAFLTDQDTLLIRSEQPVLFLQIALIYLTVAVVALVLAYQYHRFVSLQVGAQTVLDIVILSVLIYTTGAQDPGLAMLMLVAVAGGAILVNRRLATLFAALATLVLLFLEFLIQLDAGADTAGYTQVGAFGIALFLVALAGNALARGARESHALAERRGEDLADQEALNGHIVQRLQDGVLALDREGRVRLMNATAWKLLGQPANLDEPLLVELCPPLADALDAWREEPRREPAPLQPNSKGPELQPRFRVLSEAPGGGVLIFLEDRAEMNAQVQQAKLASLGRLTANIAHEIRNPLSAMTHAAQLLGEADLRQGDQRLVKIIQRHGKRLNNIVENVLRMSRRQHPNQEPMAMSALLDDLQDDVNAQPELDPLTLQVEGIPDRLVIRFDRGHLHQVLMNLITNAARHARTPERNLQITLTAGRDARDQPYLELADNGPGIPEEHRERLFEPFFTTAGDGSGLGLYLCRELCEANHARLSLVQTDETGTRFHINFAATGLLSQ